MTNVEVADTLDELADLLEIRGANPFRVRAYRNAVRTIETLTRSLQSMMEAGQPLTDLPGIGKEIDRHVRELVETGELGILRDLEEEVPRSLVTLTRIPGVGPKKAAKLWEELEIASVDALEAEIEAGRVQELQGFGPKSSRKILAAIADHREIRSRFLRVEAERLVAPVVEHLRAAPGVEAVAVAGSLRRKRDTIGDVDVLAQAADGGAVVERFTAFQGAARVEAAGETKGSIVLRSGLQVDLRVIPLESWGAALHYFTGSKEHNVRVRQLAQKKGLRVNEWGVFRPDAEGDGPGRGADAGERVAGSTEEDVFGALGMAFVPPELREDRGEVAAALDGRLPELVGLDDIRGDLQMHSTWSDGKYSIARMAEACRERGYAYMAVTDHSAALSMVQGLTPERAREQWEEIDALSAELEGFRILKSLEVDILKDGTLDMPDEILAGLDLVLVSVHSFMDMDRDAMTERVLRAVRHPLVDVLAHPTGRLLNRRKPFAMDVEAVLQACAEEGVAVEINASPNRLDLSDAHAFRARELGIPVVISTDAHTVRELDNMRYGVDQGRRAWLEKGDVLNAMEPDDLDRWLARREA